MEGRVVVGSLSQGICVRMPHLPRAYAPCAKGICPTCQGHMPHLPRVRLRLKLRLRLGLRLSLRLRIVILHLPRLVHALLGS